MSFYQEDRRRAGFELAAILGYSALYVAYLFVDPENEFRHWVTLVLIPLVGLAWMRRSAGTSQGWVSVLQAAGLRQPRWSPFLAALILGGSFCALQLAGRSGDAIRDTFASGRALYLWPMAFLLMAVTAAFTEEFFFRGLLQSRFEEATRSRLLSVILAAAVFAAYHVPYAYSGPGWGVAGDIEGAFAAAFETALPLGLLLGGLYAFTGRCLVSCVVAHALINSLPAMAIIERWIVR